MPDKLHFVMAGGGTGGHVIPALAVARELRKMGHEATFVGTERGVEARLVPQAGFALEKIEIGGLKNVTATQRLTSIRQLAASTRARARAFAIDPPAAVFSMGGYVAGPTVLAALWRKIPVVVMEPNAVPGITNRRIARFVSRALVSFPETSRYFPRGRTDVTGLPVREEFFNLPAKVPDDKFTILITGGSQGSRTLNQAAEQSWPLFRTANLPVRFIHQTGTAAFAALESEFAGSGVAGEIRPFIEDMPGAFAQADLVVCRSGAGAVAELAAAAKPSVLVPFPFAADDHQLRNAEAFERAGAARLSLDKEWTGEKFFATVKELMADYSALSRMSELAAKLAHPGAAQRAAKILTGIAKVSEKHH